MDESTVEVEERDLSGADVVFAQLLEVKGPFHVEMVARWSCPTKDCEEPPATVRGSQDPNLIGLLMQGNQLGAECGTCRVNYRVTKSLVAAVNEGPNRAERRAAVASKR